MSVMSDELDEMLTVNDVKNHLGLGTVKAYELVNLKSFPSIRIGGSIRIPKAKYIKWIDQNLGKTVYL